VKILIDEVVLAFENVCDLLARVQQLFYSQVNQYSSAL
jgi:hypothetical protein